MNDKKKILILTIAVVAIVAFFAFGTGLGPKGDITLSIQGAETRVFLDGTKITQTEKDGESVELNNTSANIHSILVHKDGYYPWEKTVTLKKGEDLSFAPFLIAKPMTFLNLDPNIETTKDEYVQVRNLLNNVSSGAITSSDNTVALKKEGNIITATWTGEGDAPQFFCNDLSCSNTATVLNATKDIQGMAFYPNRNDVVVISLGDRIDAIEIDSRNKQNFQPIYSGAHTAFTINDGKIYIKNGSQILFASF